MPGPRKRSALQARSRDDLVGLVDGLGLEVPDRRKKEALVEALAASKKATLDLFHPDMVWPWPPTARDHDPTTLMVMGRYDRERWKQSWQQLFRTYRLVHKRRSIVKITVSEQRDAALAVVDIDTFWQDADGKSNHWLGRVGKVYTRLADGDWRLIMHTGALDYSI